MRCDLCIDESYSCHTCQSIYEVTFKEEEEEMTIMLTPETKAEIDALSQYEMCRIWRFASSGHKYLIGIDEGTVGHYFAARLKEKGGFTAEISKSLGWEKP